MVVLGASVISKSGKALVLRNYVEMTRIRIEGLLAAFPKLVGSGKQHTYVETENVRYVYQPMEALYLLLVTNKQSNILEDLETLRLISKIVPEYCPALDEESVSHKAFELIFAFDEIISYQGHREPVTLGQVKQFTDMDSHEEKLHNMIMQSKIAETKDIMKRKANEIDKTKIDKQKIEAGPRGYVPGGLTGISAQSNLGGGMGMGSGGFGETNNGSAFGSIASNYGASAPDEKARVAAAPPKGKGMKLGGSSTKNQLLESLKAEGELIVEEPAAYGTAAAAGGPKAGPPVPTDPISIMIEEKLSVVLRKDGGMENLEVQGTMALLVGKDEDAYIRVVLESGENRGFQFKTHPNIDKALHQKQNALGLKDASKPFPSGNQPLGILKWRMQSKNEEMVPLSINCWPSVTGNESQVNIEYESQAEFDLKNVLISIPLPALRDAPQVNQIDGEWRYDPRRSVLEWQIVLIDDTNRSGSLEFAVPATDPQSFFPIDVKFAADKTFCDVKIKQVIKASSGEAVKFGGKTQLVVDSYQVL
ncbi:Medium subunit of clathrin adaptor complex [Klebsormidium nitens]|uniref:Coatomer subunit delta n=1 Tax=Klebsormidium nitens TaxID=105231 RepID=A0A1Y1IPT1_KLENI|nr:Medium subunit of clathrin adaptor complex [Klebsormidium nitens]|eukprot:GAQ92052.1 Medium subunit of clathrin adaptor complex [Klebsormidium nitens]